MKIRTIPLSIVIVLTAMGGVAGLVVFRNSRGPTLRTRTMIRRATMIRVRTILKARTIVSPHTIHRAHIILNPPITAKQLITVRPTIRPTTNRIIRATTSRPITRRTTTKRATIVSLRIRRVPLRPILSNMK